MLVLSRFFIVLITSSLCLSGPALAGDHHHHEHDHSHNQHKNHHGYQAHEHGVANMQLVIMENEILIEVHSPLFNMLGFEHQANSSTQQKLIQQQLQLINQAKLIELDAKAQCQVLSKTVKHPFENKLQAKDQDTPQAKHRDIHFEYHLRCQKPRNLKQINMDNLFSAWQHLQSLRVEWIYHNHQSAVKLTREMPVLSFE